MTVSVATFLAIYPEFSNVGANAEDPEAVIYRELMLQNDLCNQSAWGTVAIAERATYMITAHYLAVRWLPSLAGLRAQTQPGIASSISAWTGGLSQSMTVSGLVGGQSAFRANLAQTQYGLDYLSLMDRVVCPMEGAFIG